MTASTKTAPVFEIKVGTWERTDSGDEWWLPVRVSVAGEEFDATLYSNRAPEDLGITGMLSKVSDLLYLLARRVSQRSDHLR